MKRLIIARHAKSDWSFPERDDLDRPLKDRGISDACIMGRRMKKTNVIPDLILSSPALRAIHTALIYARELEFDLSALRLNGSIYRASAHNLMQMAESLPEEVHSVMIVGHNPAFTDLANHFLPKPVENVPTSGLVVLDFQATSWKEVSPGSLVAEAFDYPKKHRV
ncbi:MAG TPA: histidine phosphatase family protein [Bacteroidetes bacterium]|nr:histidine phosphatase family protein [Bacteroidota bacterium]